MVACMTDCMIDIETMGTGPQAAIVAIGAVTFDPRAAGDGLGAEFVCNVSLVDHMTQGGHVDGDTVLWWLGRSAEARAELTDRPAHNVFTALAMLTEFLRLHGVERPWGNGADFDLVILGSAYTHARMPRPWRYYDQRCYRTLRAVNDGVPLPERTGTHHGALDDARHQARCAVVLLREMRRRDELAQHALNVAQQSAMSAAMSAPGILGGSA